MTNTDEIIRKILAINPNAKCCVRNKPLPFDPETDDSSKYFDMGEFVLSWHQQNSFAAPTFNEIMTATPIEKVIATSFVEQILASPADLAALKNALGL